MDKTKMSKLVANKAFPMGNIGTCHQQMRFFEGIEALGYKREVDYVDSYREDTITITSEAMASDVRVANIFRRFCVAF